MKCLNGYFIAAIQTFFVLKVYMSTTEYSFFMIMVLNNKNLEEAEANQRVCILEKGQSAAGKIIHRPKGRNTAYCKQ
jgi:hypothetical protein